MCHAQKPSPPEEPSPLGQLRDFLREVRTSLSSLATLVIVAAIASSLNVAPVPRECPGAVPRPPAAAVARGDGGTMAESGEAAGQGSPASSPLTWANAVGRDGIEPPTLRFSAARSTD
jgi:hypothetical protein